jgi:glycosyltransferase involved in cell wall biosynthesis
MRGGDADGWCGMNTFEDYEGIDQVPTVSVLIPAYACDVTIGRAVRSCLEGQGALRVEVVIVHDAGDDASWKAIKAVEASYPRHKIFTWRNPTNMGPGESLEVAARSANGKYRIMLGDDDWFEAGALVELVAALQANPDAVFAYGYTKYWGARSDVHIPPAFRREDFYKGFPSLYGYLYRAAAVKGYAYRDEFKDEPSGRWFGSPDWDMCLHLLEQDDSAVGVRVDALVLHHVLRKGRMWDTVRARGGEVVAKMKEWHPKIEAVGI